MKNKTKKLIMIFILLISSILAFFLSNLKAQANFTEWAQKGFDSIKSYDPMSLFYENFNYTDADDKARVSYKYTNFLCIERQATGKGTIALKAIIDVNLDGNGYDSYKIYNQSGLVNQGNSAEMAKLAYLATYAYENIGNGKMYSVAKAFNYIWEDQNVRNWTGVPFPEVKASDRAANTYYYSACDYASNGIADGDRVLSARILVFGYGSMQYTALLYGGNAEVVSNVSIDKFITRIEDKGDSEDDAINYGDSRAGRDDYSKEIVDPVKIAYGGVKITYKIRIKNEGNRTVTGRLSDNYESTFLSNLQSSPNVNTDVTLGPGEAREYIVTLDGNSRISSGKYKNTATFRSSTNKEYSSSDLIQIGEIKAPQINKYITDINRSSFSRYYMSETSKSNTPADAGKNTENKTIYYEIKLYNPNNFEMSGTFTDEADSGISISRMRLNGSSISSGSTITLAAYETKYIYVTASFSRNTSAGIYGNTAKFVSGTIEVESRDYFVVDGQEDANVSIKKYISNVENSPGSYKTGRASMSVTNKSKYPAEVIQGSYVTYTIKITNNIHYDNTSGSCHGSLCSSHLNLHHLDWLKCTDTFNSNYLQYVSISGDHSVTYNKSTSEIKWTNVQEGDTVTANIRFKVVASNMKLTNVENKVSNVQYQYKKYRCTVYHGYYYSVPCAEHGSHTYCTHTSCGHSHNYSTITGSASGQDSDYVRLLDPEVAGVVFLDKNNNNLKNGTNENIGTMSRDQYKKITVELWNATVNKMVDSTTVNTSTGEFSFGRVRKGADRTVTQGSVNDYDYIGTGNYFYYSSEKLYTYYLVYNYDGERFIAVDNSRMTNLNRDYSMKTNYVNDSNADEIDRTGFNARLETISYNRAFGNATGNGEGKPLTYDTKDTSGKQTSNLQVSTVLWNGDTNSVLNMKAQSFTFFFNDGDVEYLKHINLGIRERDSADLSLTKDVVSAEVTVNGYQTIYNYEKLGSGDYKSTSSNTLKTPYKLRIYREDYEFRTAKYDSTIQAIQNENNSYKDLGRNNDLQIILTYKITVKNNSTSGYSAVVREIVDYSSKEMELRPETVMLDGQLLTVNQGNSSASSQYKNEVKNSVKYNQYYFTGNALNNKRLASGQSLDIYVKYRVLKDAASNDEGYIKLDFEKDAIEDGKSNIAEIAAYSIYKGNSPAGLIDKNSNPGNIEFDRNGNPNTSHFEDDTYETGIAVILRDYPNAKPPSTPTPNSEQPPSGEKASYRNISGIVWEEISKNTTNSSDGQLVGDGLKNGSDIPAQNVIVKLYEVVQKKSGTTVSEEYYVDTGLWYRTGSDGRYYFGDKVDNSLNGTSNQNSIDDRYKLHAGIYVVRFVYGDEAENLITEDGNTIKYSGQDYQSVQYKDPGNSEKEDEILEATAFATLSENTSTNAFNTNLGSKIYSVAKDNEVRRLEVNEYSTTTTYPMDSVLKAGKDSNERKILAAHTAMFADTKEFNMQIEYYGNYDSKDTKAIDGTKAIDKYYYSVKDVNFGITERPKTKLQLMNDITELRAITSDGNTLIDIFFDVIYEPEITNGMLTGIKHTAVPNLQKSTGLAQVQILNRNGNNQGFRYANIDNDILQGMTITVKFRIAVANISEVDHLSSWLEDKMKSDDSTVDLNIKDYHRAANETKVEYGSSDSIVTDYINGQEREYNYTNSYLYNLLYHGDSSKGISALRNTNTGVHTYDGTVGMGSDSIKSVYTYTNIVKKAHSDYQTGYYLGNIYYYAASSGKEARVETRVDQYIDYVDNDLIFKPEENINTANQVTYLTYTTKEIAAKGLLKDITDETTIISDGEKDYYNSTVANTNNNLAFNVENATINPGLYKFLSTITDASYRSINESDMGTDFNKNGNTTDTIRSIGNPYNKSESEYEAEINQYLYCIDLQASRTLTSEIDIEGIIVDNIAEIIKTTNTAGRKVYVKASNNATGYLGNTTGKDATGKSEIETIHSPGSSKTIVDIAKLETDTDFTEYVTFSPPTGLTEEQSIVKAVVEKTTNALLIIIPVIIIIAGTTYVTIQVIRKKKFYK